MSPRPTRGKTIRKPGQPPMRVSFRRYPSDTWSPGTRQTVPKIDGEQVGWIDQPDQFSKGTDRFWRITVCIARPEPGNPNCPWTRTRVGGLYESENEARLAFIEWLEQTDEPLYKLGG